VARLEQEADSEPDQDMEETPGGRGAVPYRTAGYVRNVNQGPGTLYNWHTTKTTVKERFAFMFNNEILADVHFKVGWGGAEQRIPAHKFVLSVGCTVFDAMFNSTGTSTSRCGT
jgi:hypothetical protein